MSTQSGIQPSQHLLDSFKSFVAGSHPVLTAHIIDETVELSDVFKGSSVKSSIDTLQSQLKDSEPQYIIIKNESGENTYTFVAYVPDYGAVRDKMLYASTKSTLIRHLGSEYFTNVLFWNQLEEVDYENLVQTITTDSSRGGLSSAEKELEQIRDSELDTLTQSTSTRKKLVSHTNGLSFKFHENTEDLPLAENDLLSFNIELPNEEVFLSNTTKISTPKEVIASISSDFPQFNILKFKGKNYFVYSCPSGSKVKDRMIYASNKQGILNHFESKYGKFVKSIEIGDPIELDVSELEENDKSSESSSNLAFSRPSRPTRRR